MPNVADISMKVARRAAYEAMGESGDAISKHIKAHSQVDGVVTGDETRLRQIITNLARCAKKSISFCCSLIHAHFQQRLQVHSGWGQTHHLDTVDLACRTCRN